MTRRRFLSVSAATAALALATALVLSGCPTSTDDGNGGGSGTENIPTLGETLKLEDAQVYKIQNSPSGPAYVKSDIDATFDQIGPANGTVKLEKGKLSFEFGTPDSADLEDVSDFLNWGLIFGDYDELTMNPADAKIINMGFSSSEMQNYISYELTEFSGSPTNGTLTEKYVSFYWVDKDVTITGKGTTVVESDGTSTTKDLSLALKEGWNAVYTKLESTKTSLTVTVVVGNPELKWAYFDDSGQGRLLTGMATARANR
jgi:hypothetical protein